VRFPSTRLATQQAARRQCHPQATLAGLPDPPPPTFGTCC